jgi:tight adherence protein C
MDNSVLMDLIREETWIFALLALSGLGLVAVTVLTLMQSRQEVRRRVAASVGPSAAAAAPNARPSMNACIDRLQGSFAGVNTKEARLLRKQFIQAGFFDPRAVAVYFAARLSLAVIGVCAGLIAVPFFIVDASLVKMWIWAGGAGLAGYLAPSFWLKRRLNKRITQHREGFPDFMDLMVVCAEAGLSTEASIDRIARELVEGYPSLAQNLYMASLEIRAGKTFTDALEHLADRLGLEEASMLATLLQQSAELGTSLALSLRVYSDEMRNKRMSRAEEKAYSLPAKLVVPLTLFVFPVLIATLMTPVVIKMSTAL